MNRKYTKVFPEQWLGTIGLLTGIQLFHKPGHFQRRRFREDPTKSLADLLQRSLELKQQFCLYNYGVKQTIL